MDDTVAPRAAPQLEEIGIGPAFKETLCRMLEGTVLFRDFARQEIETLVQFVHAYRARADTALYIEGERNNALMLITEGRVRICKQADDGQPRHLATIRRGGILGEISLIDGLPHSATATTAEDTELVMLTGRKLQRITDTYPKLGHASCGRWPGNCARGCARPAVF